ncbi:hypothetical protein ACJMK2_040879 [Sinanodonta woodiana]|uniref:protein-tyrosine-phosphatase n=1 Tax=Sinanodonta woodiana TaxID=1069815 RepID=A0ABD3W2D7_SINWO
MLNNTKNIHKDKPREPMTEFNVSVGLNKPIGELLLNNLFLREAAVFVCVCELQAFKVIECVPLSIENGNIQVVKYGDSNQTFTYGTTINVTCDEGYRMSDDGVLANETQRTLECNAAGNWSRKLTCSVTVCGRPPYFPNNSKEIQTPGIAVECNEGFNYSLHEMEPLRCASDGLWKGNLGNCNGNSSYNTTLTIECYINYTVPENKNKERWTLGTDNLVICEVIDCGRILNVPNNSTVEISTGLSGNTSYNATFTINCNRGFRYSIPGNETIRCGYDGHWTSYLGLCEVTNLTAAIVGSVVTLIILVALVVGIVLFKRRRNKHNEDATRNFDQTDEIEKKGNSNPDETKNWSNSSSNYQNGDFANITSETDADNKCYENIQTIRTNDIKIEDLFCFVLQRRSKSYPYEEEYKQATRNITKAKDVAMQAENKSKNRYKGMVPYDDNRVKLHVWDADRETDYINASFIDGFNRCQAYVAAQGPMENTLNDFSRMIWQLKTTKIVMLTNLTEGSGRKCMQYWPDEGSRDFRKINVQLIQTDQFSDFTIRTMKVKMNDCLDEGDSRLIKQFHFTAWPDKSVPRYSSSMVHFRHKIYTTKEEGNFSGPLVVHCSAGVGRTGTFIAIDFLVDQAQAQGTVNVTSCLETLRNQRVLMIQTLDQFIFVHEVLVEALTCTTVSARDFQEAYHKLLRRDPKQKKTLLQLAFEKLQLLKLSTDENTYAIAKETGNRDKNRYCNILPDENYRPYLSTNVTGRNSYINAVFLPLCTNAYKENNAFIITQTPLENTIVDFWRMVYQYDVSSIVMLNTLSQMKVDFGCCEVSKLILIYKEEQRMVRLSRARYWTQDERVPISPLHLLEHVELLHGWQTESGGRNPVVVHCMNGADRSGLFCVIAAVLERTKIEQDVAIEQIVRQLRHRRSQIIPDLEQFRFCHDALLAYLNQNDTYANF